MTQNAIKEMVADWLGASRAYEGNWPTKDNWSWRDQNLDIILTRIHPDTKKELLKILKTIY